MIRFLLLPSVALLSIARISAQDAAAPFRRTSPSPTAPAATPQPIETPAPSPAETPIPPPQETPAPPLEQTPKPKSQQQTTKARSFPAVTPSGISRSGRRALKEEPVRAMEPRKPWVRRLPAEQNEGPGAFRPTIDLSDGRWATVSSIRSLENKWQIAIKNHDVETIERLIADDFVGTSSTGTTGSKATLLRQLRTDTNDYKSARARGMSVEITRPGVAVVTGTATEAGIKENGERFKSSRQFTDTWKFKNGRWQCISSKVTPSPRP